MLLRVFLGVIVLWMLPEISAMLSSPFAAIY
jgi:hypothetical protein